MDNLTHSLVGVALGHSLGDRRAAGPARASLWTAVLASNLPDADILPAPLFDKIWFLVHHRGWTHTLVFVPLLALVAAGAVMLVRRWRHAEPLSRSEFVRLSGIAAAGVALHVLLDSLNSYGVHPSHRSCRDGSTETPSSSRSLSSGGRSCRSSRQPLPRDADG